MRAALTWDTRGLTRAMAQYARLKGKSDADVVNKAMRFWVPFAAKRVKNETPGPAKLRRALTNKARRAKGSTDGDHDLRNSVVAAVVAGRLYKKHGKKWRASVPNADFYEKVRKTLEAKVGSARYNQAGFIPAYRQFNIPNRVGGHTRFKGRSKGIKAVPSLRNVAEAFVTNQREGAAEIAPDAFRRSIPGVRRQFLRWLKQDMNRMARQSGFF